MIIRLFIASVWFMFASYAFAVEKTTLRIGIQTTGTLAWELSALPEQISPASTFELNIQQFANAEAGKIALQSGAVDIILSDWIWAAKLRTDGSDFSFYPYSTASGGVVVPEKSSIKSLKDLSGKRLGIAGGELDKNWLLLQALAQQEHIALADSVEKVFGAPPLIGEQLKQNRIDAALTYWHFAVALEAEGYRPLLDGKAILKGLGVAENVPTLGYVFKASWADGHKQALKEFFTASKQARTSLCTSDSAWKKVLPLLKTDNATTQNKLRQGYCEGTVTEWGKKQQQAAGHIYTLLRTLSHNQLTGNAETLPIGLFWTF